MPDRGHDAASSPHPDSRLQTADTTDDGAIDFDSIQQPLDGGSASIRVVKMSEPRPDGSVVTWADLLREQQRQLRPHADKELPLGSLAELQLETIEDKSTLRRLEAEAPGGLDEPVNHASPRKSAILKRADCVDMQPASEHRDPASESGVIQWTQPVAGLDEIDESSVDLRTIASASQPRTESANPTNPENVLSNALVHDDGRSSVNLGMEPRVADLLSQVRHKKPRSNPETPATGTPPAPMAPTRLRPAKPVLTWATGMAAGVALTLGLGLILRQTGQTSLASTNSPPGPASSRSLEHDADFQAALRFAEERDFAGAKAALLRAKSRVENQPDAASASRECHVLLNAWEAQTVLTASAERERSLNLRLDELTAKLKVADPEQAIIALDRLLIAAEQSQSELRDKDRSLQAAMAELAKATQSLQTLSAEAKAKEDLLLAAQSESRRASEMLMAAQKSASREAAEHRDKLTAATLRESQLRLSLAEAETSLRAAEGNWQAAAARLQSSNFARGATRTDVLEGIETLLRLAQPTLAMVQKASTRNSERAATRFSSGVRDYFAQRFNDAEACFLEAIQCDDTDARYWYFLGLTRLALDRPAEARKDLSAGVQCERRGNPDAATINRTFERIQGQPRVWLHEYRR